MIHYRDTEITEQNRSTLIEHSPQFGIGLLRAKDMFFLLRSLCASVVKFFYDR